MLTCPLCGSRAELFADFNDRGQSRMVCHPCGIGLAHERRIARSVDFAHRQIEEARAFKRNGP